MNGIISSDMKIITALKIKSVRYAILEAKLFFIAIKYNRIPLLMLPPP
jgi:hypothetical protein